MAFHSEPNLMQTRSEKGPQFHVQTDYTVSAEGLGLLEVAATSSPDASCGMSHLLHEKGVLLLACPSSLNARPPFAASLPAGRQCHHSAASSSAWLNTGAKVQTAAGSGEVRTHRHICSNTLWEKNKLHHTYMFPLFYTKSHCLTR